MNEEVYAGDSFKSSIGPKQDWPDWLFYTSSFIN